MDETADSSLLTAMLPAVVTGALVATVITYLVNRRRQTAGLARATLFLAILGFTTGLPLLIAIPAGHLALRQIRRSGGALKGKVQAWFGLLCGYAMVVLLLCGVGFTASIFHQWYRNTMAENANIQTIENAKTAWAAANQKRPGDLATASDLAPFMPGGQFPPPSVEGERYEINPVGVKATYASPPTPPP